MEWGLGLLLNDPGGYIMAGSYNTGLPGRDGSWHYGATGPDLPENPAKMVIHIDPWLFDSVKANPSVWEPQLANTLLHETAHLMGQPDHSEGVWMPPYGMQYDTNEDKPYSALNYNPDPTKSCIRYQGQS